VIPKFSFSDNVEEAEDWLSNNANSAAEIDTLSSYKDEEINKRVSKKPKRFEHDL